MPKPTDVQTLLEDLDGGTVLNHLGHVISMVAGAVDDNDKKGEVTIKLDIQKNAAAAAIVISTVSFKAPTKKGEQSEKSVSKTPFYIGSGGALSFFPENQTRMFGKKGEVETDQS